MADEELPLANGSRLERYEYSGQVSGRLFFVLAFFGIFAAGLGVLYQILIDHNPFVVLDIFLPLVLAFILGPCAIAALRLGEVRNRKAAWLVLVLLPTCALLTAHLQGLGYGREGFPGIAAAMTERLAEGKNMPSGEGKFSPSVLVIFWFIEACMLFPVAIGLPLSWWNKAVFDEQARCFVTRRKIAFRYGPSPQSLHKAANEHGLPGLEGLGLREHVENELEGEFRFYLHELEGERRYLTVQWMGKLEGPRGKPVMREVVVLRRIAVNRTFLEQALGMSILKTRGHSSIPPKP